MPAPPHRPIPGSINPRRSKSLLVLFFRKEHTSHLSLPIKARKESMFFSEEKNQKTFMSCAGSQIRDLAGEIR
jgi:hypothetical protein